MHLSASIFILISGTEFAPIFGNGICKCRKCKFALYLVHIYHHGSAPPYGAIFNVFIDEHQHQSAKKGTTFNAQFAFFWCNYKKNIYEHCICMYNLKLI